jgi:Tfp pilus tip-associated adhesin PilY1
MIETFSYCIKFNEQQINHTIYAEDITQSFKKWLLKIDEDQNEFHSFDPQFVTEIQKQASLKSISTITVDSNYFISFLIDQQVVIVYINKSKKSLPDFTADIYYLQTSEGGRKSYASSGYRPHFKLDGKNQLASCEQSFIGRDKVFPGEHITAEMRIIWKEPFLEQLFSGACFQLGEGPRIVANGKIIEVHNPDLKKI